MLVQVSAATGMGWTEVTALPWEVLETYVDVLNRRK